MTPVDNAILGIFRVVCFVNTYSLDSELFTAWIALSSLRGLQVTDQ